MSRRPAARTRRQEAAPAHKQAAPAPKQAAAPAQKTADRLPDEPAAPRRAGLPMRLLRAAGRLVARYPTASLTTVFGSLALAAVYANLVVLQPGPHPAPLFSTRPQAAAANARLVLVRDIQQGLADRGYLTSRPSGVFDRRTADAIRDFESAQGLRVTGEASEELLARLMVAPQPSPDAIAALSAPARAPATAQPASAAGSDGDARMAVRRVQKALADLGYGPLQVDGLMGGQTAAAIRRFRADHGLPAGDGIDTRLVETLVAIGGLAKS